MNVVEAIASATRTQHAPSAAALPPNPLSGEYLVFRIAAEEYGIDLLKVQEIRQFETPTRMACQPPFVKGVINLRGVIVPVLDLRALFGVEPKFDTVTVSVVINVGRRTVALVVDAVVDVIALNTEQIKPSPAFNADFDTACIAGLAAVTQGETERLLILVDVERVLAAADLNLPGTDSH